MVGEGGLRDLFNYRKILSFTTKNITLHLDNRPRNVKM